MRRIFLISGPPASGKTTLCEARAARLDRAVIATNRNYRLDVPVGWLVIDNTSLSINGTVEHVLAHMP